MNLDPREKIMLLTNQMHVSSSGGRELLCKLNHDILNDIYGNHLVVFELPRSRLQGVRPIVNGFGGHIDGLNSAIIAKAMKIIKVENVGKIFIDGSNFGEFVRVIKKNFPEIHMYTFFHNVEARFFWGALIATKTPRTLAVLIVNYLAERKSVQYSDRIICLNERDSGLLQRLYGKSATHVSPMALQDRFSRVTASSINDAREKFALFVGGTFYANRVGITWFIKHVVPYIHIKTYIVGRGFEKYKNELSLDGKVEVIGEVDSLAQWYLDSLFVIAPIFDGSGMKTKVAEALMFGKKVIGTPEAFTGYEDIVAHVGCVCTTADDFIAAIRREEEGVVTMFDPELRAFYEKKYSFQAAKSRLAGILELVE